MDTMLLVIATLLLAFITGFYTFNLSRISVFDKRYKVYESLFNLIKTTIMFKGNLFDPFSFQSDGSELDKYQRYKNSYGDPYDKFIINIESSRFLFNEEIYSFLREYENKFTDANKYIYGRFTDNAFLSSSVFEDKFKTSIQYFSSLDLNALTSKFSPYLEFEENILKYYRNLICKWCCSSRK